MSKDLMQDITAGLSGPGWVIVDQFISRSEADRLRGLIEQYEQADLFQQAGIGKQLQHQIDRDYRRDRVHWIDPAAAQPPTQAFLQRIEEVMVRIRRSCFLPLKDYECHFAVYEPGAFYVRHSDRFGHNPHRVISFVLYLNPDWEEADGGQLVLYGEKETRTVLPQAGRLALFRSEIEHEVLTAHRKRYSLTGWMKDQLNELSFL